MLDIPFIHHVVPNVGSEVKNHYAPGVDRLTVESGLAVANGLTVASGLAPRWAA